MRETDVKERMLWHLFMVHDDYGYRVGTALGMTAKDVLKLKPLPPPAVHRRRDQAPRKTSARTAIPSTKRPTAKSPAACKTKPRHCRRSPHHDGPARPALPQERSTRPNHGQHLRRQRQGMRRFARRQGSHPLTTRKPRRFHGGAFFLLVWTLPVVRPLPWHASLLFHVRRPADQERPGPCRYGSAPPRVSCRSCR